jgi:hypothetical protein
MRFQTYIPVLCFLVSACSSDGGGSEATSDTSSTESDAVVTDDVGEGELSPMSDLGEDPTVDVVEIPEGPSVVLGPITVPPFTEETQCVLVQLDNEEPIFVNRIYNNLGSHSHHMIVYAITDQPDEAEPFPCFPFRDALDTESVPLTVTQKAEEMIRLPEGVAYRFDPNQMIRLELHYINLSDEPIELTASTTFGTIEEDEFEHEAGFLFVGNLTIGLPPGEVTTIGPRYQEMPRELYGANIFAITGHTHQWGIGVTVATVEGPDGEDTTIYDIPDFNWDEPETVYYDPGLNVPEGGGFRFSCTYENLSDEEVGFGVGFNDEMCFFWGYYYPNVGTFAFF